MYKYKDFFGTEWELELDVEEYANNGNLAIEAWAEDGPYARVTVNIAPLPEGCAALDINNWADVAKFVMDNNLGTPTGEYLQSGWVTYPIFRMNMEVLK